MLIKYEFINKIDYINSLYHCSCNKGHNYQINIGLFHNRLSHSIDTCTICYPENTISSIKENEVYNFIKENYKGEIILNDRKILNGMELDIYIPNLNLAFEYNGLYWHSNIYKDDFDDEEKFDPVKLSPIRIPPNKEEDTDDIESQLIIKINKKTNNLLFNFLLFLFNLFLCIFSFLNCIIIEIKRLTPKKKNTVLCQKAMLHL